MGHWVDRSEFKNYVFNSWIDHFSIYWSSYLFIKILKTIAFRLAQLGQLEPNDPTNQLSQYAWDFSTHTYVAPNLLTTRYKG